MSRTAFVMPTTDATIAELFGSSSVGARRRTEPFIQVTSLRAQRFYMEPATLVDGYTEIDQSGQPFGNTYQRLEVSTTDRIYPTEVALVPVTSTDSMSAREQPEVSALFSEVEHEMPILLPPISEYVVRVRVHYLGEAKPLINLDDILIEPSGD